MRTTAWILCVFALLTLSCSKQPAEPDNDQPGDEEIVVTADVPVNSPLEDVQLTIKSSAGQVNATAGDAVSIPIEGADKPQVLVATAATSGAVVLIGIVYPDSGNELSASSTAKA
ncbi:unnamed protein product, partial [marine sediment metagenome]